MEREAAPVSSLPAPTKALPEGATWRPLDEGMIPAYYEAVRLAFQDTPGAFIQDLSAFAATTRTFSIKPQILVDRDGVLAFVRIDVAPGGFGQVVSLGRHPRGRGKGFGEQALYRGLELLEAHGAFWWELEVAAVNRTAIRLYERSGFQQARTTAVHRRPVRGPDSAIRT
jgi:ribosomal protein S18 acetylase RimI-like enzyme